MSRINASVRDGLGRNEAVGPSSGSLLSSSTYVSMTVIRNRGEENGEEAVERKQKEGKREADG